MPRFLAGNPVAEPWGPRTPLVLWASRDDGATWTEAASLEEGGERSYPAVVPVPGGLGPPKMDRKGEGPSERLPDPLLVSAPGLRPSASTPALDRGGPSPPGVAPGADRVVPFTPRLGSRPEGLGRPHAGAMPT